ncbi:hypothetical protein UCREL1_5767 [Eutypa lata UCREL1]|uniref:Uncharacterized protein n=1 Tax=Eutypa lata (strain UCR-EL1) TaxID=1287681 RepID=M7SSL6_EUTLA|nr:hypothetical protein UCREL1_5767 [Eutypa lata UCREL1]
MHFGNYITKSTDLRTDISLDATFQYRWHDSPTHTQNSILTTTENIHQTITTHRRNVPRIHPAASAAISEEGRRIYTSKISPDQAITGDMQLSGLLPWSDFPLIRVPDPNPSSRCHRSQGAELGKVREVLDGTVKERPGEKAASLAHPMVNAHPRPREQLGAPGQHLAGDGVAAHLHCLHGVSATFEQARQLVLQGVHHGRGQDDEGRAVVLKRFERVRDGEAGPCRHHYRASFAPRLKRVLRADGARIVRLLQYARAVGLRDEPRLRLEDMRHRPNSERTALRAPGRRAGREEYGIYALWIIIACIIQDHGSVEIVRC